MPTATHRRTAKVLVASATLLLALFLASCSKTPIICDAPSGSSGTCVCQTSGTGSCPALLNEYLYATDTSGQVLAFSISATTGALSGPISTVNGAASQGIAVVNGQFVYVSDPTDGQLDGFSLSQPGMLGTLAGSPFVIGGGSTPRGMVSVSANGSQLLYVADASGVDAFSINASGVPTAISGSPFASGTNIYVAADSLGPFVYTSVDDAPGGIFGFSIGTSGALTPISGSPFRIPGQTVANSQPAGIVDNDSFVYAALKGANQIAAFTIAAGTGALTPVANSPFVSGNGPTALALDNSLLYAINSEDSTISGYSIDSSTGGLTPLANSPFAIAGTALSADFTGQYLYVSGVSGIQVYSVDLSTGNLTAIAGSPFAASGVVSLIVVAE